MITTLPAPLPNSKPSGRWRIWKFADTSGTNNRIAAAGTVTIDGDFNIDTTLTKNSALLPTIERVNAGPDGDTTFVDYLLFTYRRSDLSFAGGVTASGETAINLVSPWTPAAGAPGVVIQVDDNFTLTPPGAANTDRVRVYLPRAPDPVLLVRLKVLVP